MTDNPDDVNFWQEVADFAYALDGEPAAFRRAALERFLAFSPKHDGSGSLEDFRRYAVLRVLEVWLGGPMERETQERHTREILQAAGGGLRRLLDDDELPPNRDSSLN